MRQVGGELLHRLVEVGDFLPLMREEACQQVQQAVVVRLHVGAHHLRAVLPQHCSRIVGEDDIVLWIALAEFRLDLGRKVVVLVLRFPIAERHAQAVEQRAVDIDARHLPGQDVVFGDELQVVRAAPAFQQVLERLAQHAFAPAARNRAQPVQFGPVFVDQLTAHTAPPGP